MNFDVYKFFTSVSIEHLAKLTPIFISTVVAYIAYLQYKINNHKLKFRRFSVYEKTLAYYQSYIAYDGEIESNQHVKKSAAEFVRVYRESIFLFGKDSSIYESLTKIKNSLSELVSIQEYFKSKNLDKDKSKAYSNRLDTLPSIEKELEMLELLLTPWLDFKKISK